MKSRSAWARWRLRAISGVLALAAAAAAQATDFALQARDPGPGHRIRSYWWNFNNAAWELTPPEGYSLQGGGELRLEKNDAPALVAVCRQTTAAESKLLGDDDPQAQADYVRTLLPGGVTDVRLIAHSKNPLPVNGLTNFEASYSYLLGGIAYELLCMVSQGGEMAEQSPPIPGQPTPTPTPAPPPTANGKPVRTGQFFTTIIATPLTSEPLVYGAFQQLMATARIKPGNTERDDPGQYSSHGMLGR